MREMKKVYIELVLLDNFLMDFVILFFAVRLSEKRVQFSRISLGAGIGAVYSAFALGFPLLSGLFIKCMALGLMCLPLGARPFKRYLLRCGLALLCSFLFGGCIFFAMLALGAPLEGAYLGLPILRYVLLGVAAGIVLIEFYQRIPHPRSGAEYLIHAEFCDAGVNLRGFLDTGNLLQSPGGIPIIIMAEKTAGEELKQAISRQGVFSLPCLTASGKSELPAFLPDKLIITTNGKSYTSKAYLALTDAPLPSGYTALLGPDLKLFPL